MNGTSSRDIHGLIGAMCCSHKLFNFAPYVKETSLFWVTQTCQFFAVWGRGWCNFGGLLKIGIAYHEWFPLVFFPFPTKRVHFKKIQDSPGQDGEASCHSHPGDFLPRADDFATGATAGAPTSGDWTRAELQQLPGRNEKEGPSLERSSHSGTPAEIK